jgi:MtaA/CmuA family methyltransferase
VTREFGVDQVSAISDPWREASGYGMEFDYPEDAVGVPKAPLLTCPEDVAKLGAVDVDAAPRMRQRVESVAAMATELGETHSVLGWVEGPIAAYADLRGVEATMMDLVERPEMFHQAAEILTLNAIAFAGRQVEAGADMIGVGDAAASLIGPELYRRHVLPWEQKLFAGLRQAGALGKLHICGNITSLLADLGRVGADVIDLDWMVPIAKAREALGPAMALCGNFDPVAVLLRGTPAQVAAAALECVEDGNGPFILQPGCEVPPGTPAKNLRAFCPCGRSFQPAGA